MTADLTSRLRRLPPDLPTPPDRMEQIAARVRRRRRRRGALMAGASVIVLGGVVPFILDPLLGRDRPPIAAEAASLSCPREVPGPGSWVPHVPRGVDAANRLVPADTPLSAVVCAFDSVDTSGAVLPAPLRGRAELTSGLRDLARDLAWVAGAAHGPPDFCSGGGPSTTYLLGLTYVRGTVWVSASDGTGCIRTSNGAFDTMRGLGPQMAAALDAGRWTGLESPPSAQGDCPAVGWGRHGQESVLVPPSPTSLTVCRAVADGSSAAVTRYGAERAAAVAKALNGLPNDEGRLSDQEEDELELHFHYEEGPDVQVRVRGKAPASAGNGTVVAKDVDGVISALLRQWTSAR
jgi:hypothetical protein